MMLFHYFLNREAQKLNFHVEKINSDVIDYVRNNLWHGNVRELENFVKYFKKIL